MSDFRKRKHLSEENLEEIVNSEDSKINGDGNNDDSNVISEYK